MTLSALQDHLRMLAVEERLLLEECDWDALARLRMAIDDTHDQIATLEKE
jgi:hypothetical protein